ncbi:MAG: hypothetical protein IJV15_12075 [Lachnospiraceae bacterium]|nr:hypothetical protein [Lachnospiraceae bacterium]
MPMLVCACGKKDNTPEFSDDGMLVKLSATPKDIEEEPFTYTTNIEVYSDGTVKIYADNFSKWYGKDEPDVEELKIDDSELGEIKQAIVDEDLYHLHEDVGNKDGISGVEKKLTVYTKSGEYSVYGINPSNVKFNKVYDLIYGLRRDELATYILYIEDIQKKGSVDDIGVTIEDSCEKILFDNSDIKDIYIEDVSVYSEEEDEDLHEDNTSKYKIVIELTDENVESLYEMTKYADSMNYVAFNLYVDKSLNMILYTDVPIEDGKIYSNSDYTEEAAENAAEMLVNELK